MVSSLKYGLFPASLASGQKSGQPLAMFISLTGRWKEVEVMSGRKASIMCSLLFWSNSISVTWGPKEARFTLSVGLWGCPDRALSFPSPSDWTAISARRRICSSWRRRRARGGCRDRSHHRSNIASDTFCSRTCWSKTLQREEGFLVEKSWTLPKEKQVEFPFSESQEHHPDHMIAELDQILWAHSHAETENCFTSPFTWWEHRWCSAAHCLLPAVGEICDLPHEYPIVGAVLELPHHLFRLGQLQVLHGQGSLQLPYFVG